MSKEKEEVFYKAFRADGFDFYTGKTIDYAKSIGKTVKVPGDGYRAEAILCTDSVLHASKTPRKLTKFIAAYPFRVVKVRGSPALEDEEKAGFKEFKVIAEEKDLDALFGVKWAAMVELTINPTKVAPKPVAESDLAALKQYAGLRGLRGLWGLRGLRDLWDLWDLWDLRGLWDLWDLRGLRDLWDLRGLRGLWDLWDLRGLWDLQLSYLVSEVITERERWLAKHTYLVEPCESLIALVKAGYIPTYNYEKKEWTLWQYVDGKWKKAWKGKVDASHITKELDKKHREAIA